MMCAGRTEPVPEEVGPQILTATQWGGDIDRLQRPRLGRTQSCPVFTPTMLQVEKEQGSGRWGLDPGLPVLLVRAGLRWAPAACSPAGKKCVRGYVWCPLPVPSPSPHCWWVWGGSLWGAELAGSFSGSAEQILVAMVTRLSFSWACFGTWSTWQGFVLWLTRCLPSQSPCLGLPEERGTGAREPGAITWVEGFSRPLPSPGSSS